MNPQHNCRSKHPLHQSPRKLNHSMAKALPELMKATGSKTAAATNNLKVGCRLLATYLPSYIYQSPMNSLKVADFDEAFAALDEELEFTATTKKQYFSLARAVVKQLVSNFDLPQEFLEHPHTP